MDSSRWSTGHTGRAASLLNSVFSGIEKATTRTYLDEIVGNNVHLRKNAMQEFKYPKLCMEITEDNIKSLKDAGMLDDNN
jgi:hypothetical protein